MQISVGHGDGASRMLIIGGDVPEKPGMVYARRADDTSVFSVSDEIRELLNVPAEQFRDAGVLSVPPGSISSIGITRGEDQLILEYDGSNDWNITSPMVWTAEPRAVSDLVTLWVNAVITEFDVPVPSGDPEWILEFSSAERETANRLEIFTAKDSKEGLLLRRDDGPTAFRINLPLVPDSIIDPLNYKDRSIWVLDPEQVTRVELQKAGGDRQVVERLEDNSFAAAETNGNVLVDDQALGRLLRSLKQVSTTGYITYNPRNLDIYGLAEPAAALHLGLSGTNQLGRVLLVGRETADGFYSMVKGRDVVFFLDKPAVMALTADFIQQAEILETPIAE